MIGEAISHYAPEAPACRSGRHPTVADNILEEVGEGGTGVVYKVPIRLNLTSGVKLSSSVGLKIPTAFVGTRRGSQ